MTGRDGDIHGNKNSKIYHLPTCPGYMGMNQVSVVTFSSETEAQQAGYRKAKNCP
jgi:deoxyribonuclease-1